MKPSARFWLSALLLAGVALAGYNLVWVVFPSVFPLGDPASWPITNTVSESLMTVAALCIAVLGFHIVWGPALPEPTLIFSLYLAALALVTADTGRFHLLDALLESAGFTRPFQNNASALVFAVALSTCLAAGLRWTQLFPHRLVTQHLPRPSTRPLVRVQEWLARGATTWIVIGIGGFVLVTSSAFLLRRFPGLQFGVVLTFSILVLALATMNLRTSFRTGSPDDRSRIYWVLEAGIVGTTLSVVALGVELGVHSYGAGSSLALWLHAILLPLAMLSLVSLLCIAVLYRGAIDSRLVIKKTVLYTSTGVLLTAVFVFVEVIFSEFLVARFGLPDRAGGWLAGLCVAFTFGPLKNKLERQLTPLMNPPSHQQHAHLPTRQ